MKKPDPINKVQHKDEFSSGLMESYGRWMGGDTFQGTQMPELHLSEAPFDGMDPQSNGAEIEQTSIKKKEAKKPSAKAQLAANEEVLEREEYEIDGETYVIEKAKGLDGKACWKGYKLAGTKMKGGKRVDNCVKAGVEYQGNELTEGKEKCPKCGGSGLKEGKECKHCGGTGYHTMKEYFEKDPKSGKMVKKHNCAKKVKKEGKEYFCIPEQHTMLEDGTVTHYDLVSEKGEVLRNVPVEGLEIMISEVHEHADNHAKNAELLGEKKLDPVGGEDKDIDNDGDHDKSDKYLLARRKKVGKIIAMKKKK